ncbi:MAG: transposase [Alphaproteobacteria bacterium]|nr:transposase [Alphaproteobacteria bacterium]
MEAFFAKLSAATIGIEACGSAHHWARRLQALGHTVRLVPAAYVRPFVKRNKTDAHDAAAICEAMQRPGMRFVPVKSIGSRRRAASRRCASCWCASAPS